MKPETVNVRLLLQVKGYFILKSHGRLVDYMDEKNQEHTMKNENIFFPTITFGKSQFHNIEGSMLLNELQTIRFSISSTFHMYTFV